MRYLLILLFLSANLNLRAQKIRLKKHILNGSLVTYQLDGNKLIITKDTNVKEVDEPTFVKIENVLITNGLIEVEVLSKLTPQAPDYARGFIGIAFYINPTNSNFQAVYLRPSNAESMDQVRRNHSIQYFSYPRYKFDILRNESPEKYETYADISMNKWIKMKLQLQDGQVKLFVNGSSSPNLVINDLKGEVQTGGIGLWVDIGTKGYFRRLKITKFN